MLNEKCIIIPLTVWFKVQRHNIKMSRYFHKPDEHYCRNVKVKLDISYYAEKQIYKEQLVFIGLI